MGTAAACPLPQPAFLLEGAPVGAASLAQRSPNPAGGCPRRGDVWRACCTALLQPGGSEGRETPVLGSLCSGAAQRQLPKISFST